MTFECGKFKGCNKCQCMVCKHSNKCDRWGICNERNRAVLMSKCDMFSKKVTIRRRK